MALDAGGLVTAGRWRALRSDATTWLLEEHDGRLWQLQGVSNEPASTARFVLEPRKHR